MSQNKDGTSVMNISSSGQPSSAMTVSSSRTAETTHAELAAVVQEFRNDLQRLRDAGFASHPANGFIKPLDGQADPEDIPPPPWFRHI
jgi:phage gp45-like